MIGYLYLGIAISGEILGTTLLKYTNGFTKAVPTAGALLAYIVCFYFLAKSLSSIKLSIAYASWSGLGIVAAALLSVFLFNEQLNLISIIGILLIVTGVIILSMFVTSH